MQHFVNWQTPLWEKENQTRKLFDIPIGAFVEPLADINNLTYIKYKNYFGYIEQRFLEEYQRNLPFDCVKLSDIQTPNDNDFEQYVNWKNTKQVNMCGEICAARIFEVGLSDVFVNWEAKNPSFFWRVFGKGKARGTNADELITLFEIYGMEAQKIKISKYTPTLWKDLTESHHLICGVKMNGSTGELRRGSIPHWAILLSITLERKNMGWVQVFNPAQNCEEIYSWSEWLATAGVPYGVTIKKS